MARPYPGLFIVAIALFMVLAQAMPVAAAMIIVGGSSAYPCNETGLKKAIDDSNGATIGFACTTPKITFTSQKTIIHNVHIDGTNGGATMTISGGNTTRIFYITGGVTLELDNLILTAGIVQTGNGGAIYNDGGTLRATNSAFTNNAVSAAFNGSSGGGAIYNNVGTVLITNSTFKRNGTNGGTGSTGATGSKGTAATYNTPGGTGGPGGTGLPGGTASGGAIQNEGGTLVVTGSVFDSNEATGGSGGNGGDGGTGGDNYYSCFYGCTAMPPGSGGLGGTGGVGGSGEGGGIGSANGTVIVSTSSFLGNYASSGYGGWGGTGGHGGTPNCPYGANGGTGGTGGAGGSGNGGGIYVSAGVITVTNSTFTGNISGRTEGGRGGVGGDASNAACTGGSNGTSGNGGDGGDGSNGYGGAFGSDSSTVVMINSTVSQNQATAGNGNVGGFGGVGVYQNGIGKTGHSGSDSGGGLYSTNSRTRMLNNTVVANFAGQSYPNGSTDSGGNFWGSNYTVKNTIIISGTPANCAAPLISQGHNLENTNTCGLSEQGDQANQTRPGLGPLQNNGGATMTHALLPESPAIKAGDTVGCPATDQRGYYRAGGCDIGSYAAVLEGYIPVALHHNAAGW